MGGWGTYLRYKLKDLVQFVAPIERLVCARAPPRHGEFGHFIQGSLNNRLTYWPQQQEAPSRASLCM